MSEQDMNNIKKMAEHHEVAPRPEAWKKLNDKLRTRKAKHRLYTYRNISIAAILISVLSVTAVFTMYLGKHNPDIFSSNQQFRPVVLEDLSNIENDPFYDVKYIDQLHTAYSRIGFK